jgi:hypothetical protein
MSRALSARVSRDRSNAASTREHRKEVANSSVAPFAPNEKRYAITHICASLRETKTHAGAYR